MAEERRRGGALYVSSQQRKAMWFSWLDSFHLAVVSFGILSSTTKFKIKQTKQSSAQHIIIRH